MIRGPVGVTSAMSPSWRMTHVLGVLQDRRHVARQEALAVAEPDDERHVHPRTDDPVRMVGVHHTDGVGAAHLVERHAHRLDQVAS